MKTIELIVATTTAGSELIADFLSAESYGGILIKDKNDILALQREKKETWDYIDDSLLTGSDVVLVSGFVEKKKQKEISERLEEFLRGLKSNVPEIDFGALEVKTRAVDDKAWHKVWKKNFRPIKIGKIVICPKWIKQKSEDGEQIVLLDSGMAFGTGEHETTSMCIDLMQRFDMRGALTADVGCGSGILGITAVKLGAKFSYMTDIDSMAVAASRQNAKLNKVTDKVQIESRSLLEGAEIKADFVFANLTANLLVMLSEEITAVANDGAVVIMSGIINTKIEEVTECYLAAGFTLCEKSLKNDWCALAFRRGA